MIKTNQRPGGKQIQPIKCVVYAISISIYLYATNENREWNPANCLMRGKNMNDEVGIGFRSAWLIGWEGGGSFLDQSRSEAKQNQWDPRLLLTRNWKLLFWYLYCSNVFFFLFHRPSSNPWVQSAVIVYYPGSIWAVLTFPWWCARRPCTCGRLWSLTRLVS